jgi:NTE family protein
MANEKPKIGLSFSGGGARAAAHIGVIQALNERGIKADCVTGTSGGAIIAALYAAGLSVEKMLEFAKRGNLLSLYKWGLPILGLTKLDYLGELLGEYIEDNSFESLKIPLSVTATNLETGNKVILDEGELYSAVMASCAIPLIFNPVEINGATLVDGGLFDNLPVEPLLADSTYRIGVNVIPNVPTPKNELDDMFTIGMRVFHVMVAHNSQLNFPKFNVIIEPKEVMQYGLFNFDNVDALYELGYQETVGQMEGILEQLNNGIYE